MTRRGQQGFTFIELMVSAAATGVVILAATAFLIQALGWYDELSAKIEINRHARETYNLLAFGGTAAAGGNDGTKNLYSIRGRSHAPATGLRSNYALQYISNNLTLTPDRFAGMTLACVSTANPLPDCGSGSKSVQGWLGKNIEINAGSRSVAGKTVEVQFTVMNPFELQRAQNPALFATAYRAIFTLNRDEDDP